MAQGNEDLPLLYGSPAMTLGQLFPGLTELQSLQLRECEHQCIGSTWQRNSVPSGPKVPHCVLSMVSSNIVRSVHREQGSLCLGSYTYG